MNFQVKTLETFNPFARVTHQQANSCLLYTYPNPRDYAASRMPSSAGKKKINKHYHTLHYAQQQTKTQQYKVL